jgi:hypothetical protein
MLNSKWLSFIFFLAFAISTAHSITPHSHARANSAYSHSSHHQEHNKSSSHNPSELRGK